MLEPIPNIPRRTIGREALVNPEELNGQINFFTTSGKVMPLHIVIYEWKLGEPVNTGCDNIYIVANREKLNSKY